MGSVSFAVGKPEDRGPEIVAFTWVFTSLATVIVCLKVYTRVKIIKEPALDDLFTVLSLVFVLIYASVLTASVKAGMGRHVYDLTLAQTMQATKLSYIGNPFRIMAYSLPNVSVALFIQRILNLPKMQKWAIYSMTIAQNVFAGISILLPFTQCSPTYSLWNPKIPAKCISMTPMTNFLYFTGAYTAFTDVLLAVIPIVAFWKLQMKLKTKVGVCLLMSMTAFAAICAIVKTTKYNELADREDFTYGLVDICIWALVETDVIIIAACIPAMRPFAVSVTGSMRDIGGKSRPKRNVYQAHTNGRALAQRQTPPEQFGNLSNAFADNTRSNNSLLPAHIVRQTTDIELGWE